MDTAAAIEAPIKRIGERAIINDRMSTLKEHVVGTRSFTRAHFVYTFRK